MAILLSPALIERFHSKTAPGPKVAHMDTPCTLWTAGGYSTGYGQFSAGVKVRAHRYAYLIAHGEGSIPAGMFVCHKCDVRRCVNPDHLYLGDSFDNMRDRLEREGYKTVPRGEVWRRVHANDVLPRGDVWHQKHPPSSIPRGEEWHAKHKPETVRRGVEHHAARLTPDDVRAIRAAYSRGKEGVTKGLATRYGVSDATIYSIMSGRTWSHVV